MSKGLSEAAIQRLGKEPDSSIARDEDVSIYTVRNARQRLGIPIYRATGNSQRRKIPWDSVVHRMGVDSDREIARDLGVSIAAVQLQRSKRGIPPIPGNEEIQWTPEMVAQLGMYPDVIIAKRYGISAQTVAVKRRDLGISTRHTSYYGVVLSRDDFTLLKALAQRLQADPALSKHVGTPPSIGKAAGIAVRLALSMPDNDRIRAALPDSGR